MDAAAGGGPPGRHTITLPPAVDSPRAARRFVLGVLGDWLDSDTLDSALLLVTELVTNVVVHAGTNATVEVRPEGDGVTVGVGDRHRVLIGATDGYEAGIPGFGGLREDGRGLALVDALATSWGTEHGGGGKTVWFRLSPPPAAAVAGQRAAPDERREPTERRHPVPRRHPRILARDTARALTAEDEVGELLAQLIDALPVTGGIVRRPSADRTRMDLVASLGATGTPRDAVTVALDPTQDSLGELLLWPKAASAPGIVAAEPVPASLAGPAGSAGQHVPPWLPLRTGTLGREGGRDGRHDGGRHGGHDGGHDGEWPGRSPVTAGGALGGEADLEHIRLAARWMALALGGGDMRRAEERRIGMLSFLAEASDLLAGSLDVGHSLTLLARLPVPRLARWCAVYLRRDDDDPVLCAVAHAEEAESAAVWRSAADPDGSLMAAVRAAGGTKVPTVTALDGPTLVVVLRARRRVLGVLALGRPAGSTFAPDEVDLLTDLARRAAFAVDNARLYSRQVEVAKALQAGLRPPDLPTIDSLDLGSAYGAVQAAGLDVGGDFFDLVSGPTGWTLAIGDVCGKGAEAATVTGAARAVLRLLSGRGVDAGRMLAELNRALRDTTTPYPHGQGRFCTLAAANLVEVSPAGTRVRLYLAGHPQPVLLRADGTASLVGLPGTLLGVLDDDEVSFPGVELWMRPGDALVLYTDGVIEARRGRELLGDDRLLRAVEGCAGLSAQGVADRVRATAERFSGERLRDDVAILVARVPHQPRSEDWHRE